MYQFTKLKEFLSASYPASTTQFPLISISEFKTSAEQLYNKIHKDCLRSLHLSKKVIPDCNVTKLQNIFESYFIHIISLSPIKANHYYQGLTDIFEVIFLAYIKIDSLEQVEFLQQDFPPLELSLDVFFDNLNDVLNVSTGVLTQLFNQTHFETQYFIDQCNITFKLIQNNDKDLYKLLQKCELQAEVLLKYQFSSGVRYAMSPAISEFLLIDFIQNPEQRTLETQQLISACFRSYAPNLLPQNDIYKVNFLTENMKSALDKTEILMYCLTNAFTEVFSIDQNLEPLTEYLQNAHEKALEKSEKTAAAKAISIGVGIGIGLFGVVGGIIGAVATSVMHEKRKEK